MITYKSETLHSLISFLQASGIRYEEFCSIQEQHTSLPGGRAFFVSLWAALPWSRTVVQKVLVKVSPDEYRIDCSCAGFFGSKELCWHAALVLYWEQFYLDYEKKLLQEASAGDLGITEQLLDLRAKYFGSWFEHHMNLKAAR